MDPLWLLGIGIIVVFGGIMLARLPAFLALVLGALVVGALTPAASLQRHAQEKKMSEAATEDFVTQPLGKRVAAQFGNTCASIGILIALASVIGKCLLDSGAADKIVRAAIRRLGEPRAPLAFLGSGFLLGIPVFFDTVFYLLIPLGKALRLRTDRNYTLYVLSIIAGGTMTHSLVPPTPGPLFVAAQLGVSVGMMMLAGLAVGILTATSGYLYAVWLNRRLDVPLRDTADATVAQLTAITQRDERELPPLGWSLFPILLPVLLIGGNALLQLDAVAQRFDLPDQLLRIGSLVGDPNVALAIAAAIGIGLLISRPQLGKPFGAALEQALTGGGLIILITAAGGAFGGMLQQTGVGARLESLATAYQIGVLPLAWFVTVLIRTAQGSATVAMITAVGILGNLVHATELPFHPVYVALAIGCGSKPFPWMNDSGFWIISRMSGMTVGETIKSFSVMQCVMSLTGLATILVLAKLFPLI